MTEEQILAAFGLEPEALDGPEFADYRRARAEADAAMAAYAAKLQARADEIAAGMTADLRRMGALSDDESVSLTVKFDG